MGGGLRNSQPLKICHRVKAGGPPADVTPALSWGWQVGACAPDPSSGIAGGPGSLSGPGGFCWCRSGTVFSVVSVGAVPPARDVPTLCSFFPSQQRLLPGAGGSGRNRLRQAVDGAPRREAGPPLGGPNQRLLSTCWPPCHPCGGSSRLACPCAHLCHYCQANFSNLKLCPITKPLRKSSIIPFWP